MSNISASTVVSMVPCSCHCQEVPGLGPHHPKQKLLRSLMSEREAKERTEGKRNLESNPPCKYCHQKHKAKTVHFSSVADCFGYLTVSTPGLLTQFIGNLMSCVDCNQFEFFS